MTKRLAGMMEPSGPRYAGRRGTGGQPNSATYWYNKIAPSATSTAGPYPPHGTIFDRKEEDADLDEDLRLVMALPNSCVDEDGEEEEWEEEEEEEEAGDGDELRLDFVPNKADLGHAMTSTSTINMGDSMFRALSTASSVHRHAGW